MVLGLLTQCCPCRPDKTQEVWLCKLGLSLCLQHFVWLKYVLLIITSISFHAALFKSSSFSYIFAHSGGGIFKEVTHAFVTRCV